MDKTASLEMIKALSDANGVSGFEDQVLTVLRTYGKDLGEFREDSLRNLYLSPPNNGLPVVQLDAHSDEVGFMIQAVLPNGTLKFIPIGGWVGSNIPAHRVRVLNREGIYITGIVASKPPHFMSDEEKKKSVQASDMVIDVGAVSDEEIYHDFKIAIGAPVVPDVDFEYNAEKDLMIGKAFDCRLGCGCIIDTMKQLKNAEGLNVNVIGAFSSQEEVGIKGATVTANTVHPDIAIVFEGCPADDTFSERFMIQTAMKKGPMLRHIDAGMITNPRYQRFALDMARSKGIPVQEAIRTGGSTNGRAIHISNNGVPVIVIGLPVRYIHTHYGFASFMDYTHAVSLAVEIIKALDKDIIKGF